MHIEGGTVQGQLFRVLYKNTAQSVTDDNTMQTHKQKSVFGSVFATPGTE